MSLFLVEIKINKETKSFKLSFKNKEEATEWGDRQAKHWKLEKYKVIITPITKEVLQATDTKEEEKPKKKTKKGKIL